MYIKVENDSEAGVAAQAIASYRYELACHCDFTTGYSCDRCNRLLGPQSNEQYETFMERYSDLIYNKRVVRSPEEQGEAETQPITAVHLSASQIAAYDELLDWVVENHGGNEHVSGILKRIG